MEKLLEDLKTGRVSPKDLDEQTELEFIMYMKDYIKNNMVEIENINRRIQETQKDTAQILEETKKIESENIELKQENAKLDEQLIQLALATEDYQNKINQIKGNLNS